MSTGKLVTLALVLILARTHQDWISERTAHLRTLPGVMRTHVEMRQYKTALLVEMGRNNGTPPRDYARYLDRRFHRPGRSASVDEFGSRYLVERASRASWTLRSCGPDTRCWSEDDLVAHLGA